MEVDGISDVRFEISVAVYFATVVAFEGCNHRAAQRQIRSVNQQPSVCDDVIGGAGVSKK